MKEIQEQRVGKGIINKHLFDLKSKIRNGALINLRLCNENEEDIKG
jgi:hypothetical protein